MGWFVLTHETFPGPNADPLWGWSGADAVTSCSDRGPLLRETTACDSTQTSSLQKTYDLHSIEGLPHSRLRIEMTVVTLGNWPGVRSPHL